MLQIAKKICKSFPSPSPRNNPSVATGQMSLPLPPPRKEFQNDKWTQMSPSLSSPEMEFLDISLTKDSSLLLHAIHTPFYDGKMRVKTRAWEDSSLCPEPSTKNAVQEFHLRKNAAVHEEIAQNGRASVFVTYNPYMHVCCPSGSSKGWK